MCGILVRMFKAIQNKWTLLAFLCGLFLVYTVDRAILGVLAIPIQEELKLSDVQFGLLSSGIFWTYAIVVPFAGLIGDRFNRSRLIGWAAIFWMIRCRRKPHGKRWRRWRKHIPACM